MSNADTVIVLDFETTGLSPDHGDRAIEIGAVKIEAGVVTDRFQALMNPGRRINSFIENYTGITNYMLQGQPSCEEVMQQFADFIQGFNLVAHNSSFDKRFLDAELTRISRYYQGDFACSMLIARRIYQNATNHKLSTLIDYTNIHAEGEFHRALFDAEMTAKLWLVMLEQVRKEYTLDDIPFSLAQKIAKTPKNKLNQLLANRVINAG
ncbi:3'-5' exonuclease [Paraglaciecola aquimarina]|uniref:DNA-directed DNA polymerase n=1 Tax=Paraglaciecola algarum TaxID=3050085 RepID=A0ABS9D5M6_9ALTE|nr:3'-5' exonuclease [Paraglaciecola sp. G1-23]